MSKVTLTMCADFIHPGHVNILKIAASYGPVTVWLMTDEAMIAYKRKPFFSYEDRALVVMAIKGVDQVIPCSGLDKIPSMLEAYKPDVFVHGDDWKKGPQSKTRALVSEFMEITGGRLIEPAYTPGISSSHIHKALQLNN